MTRILPLPPSVAAQIHSSKNIVDLQGVVQALVENSLDAGASTIEVSVDFRRGSCTVRDNGLGIAPVEFEEDGGLGKFHHTSKHSVSNATQLHGQAGIFLASLAALSLLQIESQHHEHSASAGLVMHHGTVVARHVDLPNFQRIPLHADHGTCVSVRDLFGNFPVRVKQRAQLTESSTNQDKQWQKMEQMVISLLLAWPNPCAVRIRDLHLEDKVIYRLGIKHTLFNSFTKRNLDQLNGKPCKLETREILQILLESSLGRPARHAEWTPVSASSTKMYVKGFISPVPAPTKRLQFLSIGIQPCLSSRGHNELYDSINRIFHESDFGMVESDAAPCGQSKGVSGRYHDYHGKDSGSMRMSRRTRRSVDIWPMYVLQVRLTEVRSPITASNTINGGLLRDIIGILETTVRSWLKLNHFQPRKQRSHKRSTSALGSEAATSDTATLPFTSHVPEMTHGQITNANITRQEASMAPPPCHHSLSLSHVGVPNSERRQDFKSWSRIKSGQDNFYNGLWANKPPQAVPMNSAAGTEPMRSMLWMAHNDAEEPEIYNHGGEASVPQQAPTDDQSMPCATDVNNLHGADGIVSQAYGVDKAIVWTDSTTGKNFHVNTRTGAVLLPHLRSTIKLSAAKAEGVDTIAPDATKRISRVPSIDLIDISPHSADGTASVITKWLPGFLDEWENPVFPSQRDRPIPSALAEQPYFHVPLITPQFETRDFQASTPEEIALSTRRKLTKSMLQLAEVIRQVDRKFILCRTRCIANDGHSDIIFLVDQHAVSERIILENLLEELCTPENSGDSVLAQSTVKCVRPDRPILFEISEEEHHLFQQCCLRFNQWGVLYELSNEQKLGCSPADKLKYVIAIHALPPGIAARCFSAPTILIELLRQEIWRLDEAGQGIRPVPHHDPSNGEPAWVIRLETCPRGILDLLNSRACRCAIMFNDELTLDECQKLLSKLSQCKFPFICAHGRISMIPAVEIPENSFGHHSAGEKGAAWGYRGYVAPRARAGRTATTNSFTTAFKRWKAESSDKEDHP